MSDRPFLEVKNLVKHFPISSKGVFFKKQVGIIHAVDGVSFSVDKGTTLGLVGESGCGKTSTARAILYLDPPTSGEMYLDGEDIKAIFKSKKKRSFEIKT